MFTVHKYLSQDQFLTAFPTFRIFFAALSKDQIRIVQASLLGSILANLLVVLGTAFIVGGLRFEDQLQDRSAGRVSVGLLNLGLLISIFPVSSPVYPSW